MIVSMDSSQRRVALVTEGSAAPSLGASPRMADPTEQHRALDEELELCEVVIPGDPRVLPGMQTRRWGRIIQIDSEVVDRPPPGRSAYVIRKMAQVGLSRSWARELAPAGITVNTVAPGFVPVERHTDVSAEVRSAYLSSVPAGRMGTPEEIAHAVSFFASEAAGFVTGQCLVVDGGRGLG